jgi:hypothetical protein
LPDFDMGAYEAVATTQGELTVFPRTINHSSQSQRIFAVMRLPELVVKNDVDAYEPLVFYPGAIKAAEQYIIPPAVQAKSNVRIHAFFDKDEMLADVPNEGDLEVTVIGRFVSGKYFYSTDKIRIISTCDDEER